MINFILGLQFIFRPSFWIMNERYSKTHDIKINKLLDENKLVRMSRCRHSLGGYIIWTGNYPYGVGIDSISSMSRPSRLTIKRLGQRIIQDGIDEMIDL